MAKKVDISEKLNFEENPVIVIDGQEFEVNTDAETMLRIMGLYEDEESEIKAVKKTLELLFNEKDCERIYELRRDGNKLSIKDLVVISEAAVDAAMGDSGGEKE